jgi:hypothetical protein
VLIKKNIALGLTGTALVLGAGLGVAGVANAATATPAPSPSSSASADSSSGEGQGLRGGRHGGGKGGHVQAADLAAKLGVEEAKVTEALQAFRDANRPAVGTAAGEKPDHAAMQSALAASLAESLGIEEAKVTAALEEIQAEAQAERAAALKTRLDAAVADGTLTQAEADGAAKAVEKGVIRGGR